MKYFILLTFLFTFFLLSNNQSSKEVETSIEEISTEEGLVQVQPEEKEHQTSEEKIEEQVFIEERGIQITNQEGDEKAPQYPVSQAQIQSFTGEKKLWECYHDFFDAEGNRLFYQKLTNYETKMPNKGFGKL